MTTAITNIQEAFASFAKALLDDAIHDSPAEIEDWGKSDLCKLLCGFYGINRNTYKNSLKTRVLEKKNQRPIWGLNEADAQQPILEPACERFIERNDDVVVDKTIVTEAPLPDRDDFIFPIEEQKLGPLFQTNTQRSAN